MELRCGQFAHFQTFLRNIHFLENTAQKNVNKITCGMGLSSWTCEVFVFNAASAYLPPCSGLSSSSHSYLPTYRKKKKKKSKAPSLALRRQGHDAAHHIYLFFDVLFKLAG